MLGNLIERYGMTTATSPAHAPAWYAKLAGHLGHRGYVTLAEIRDAERAGWQPALNAHIVTALGPDFDRPL